MPTAVASITERVRERLRQGGVDLAARPEAAGTIVREEVRRYAERALAGDGPLLGDEPGTARQVLAQLTGYGPLQPLFDDPSVEEIWVNGVDKVFAARHGVSEATGIRLSQIEIRDLVERMLQTSGRRVDLSSPFVDASLPDGSRLHVTIPDITREWSVNIRRFPQRIRSLQRLVELGSLDAALAEVLRAAVRAGRSILVTGATQAGKTTTLAALLGESAPSDRIVTVEETFELAIEARDVVAMQCRQPSLEGTGEVTLRRLVKEALRMRPDRIVVGEVRDAEALDLLLALNAGLPGMCTLHANSARDALAKLCTLPLLAGRNIDAGFILPTVAASLDLVVHCELLPDGRRRIREVIEPTGVVGSTITARTVYDAADAVPAAPAPAPLPERAVAW